MKNFRNNCKITIDGPAGSGKSSLAKLMAKHFELIHLDTGALYRAIALYFIQNFENFDSLTDEEVKANLKNININYSVDKLLLNGVDITSEIRTNLVSQNASIFASRGFVRDFCNEIQQEIIAKNNNIVMDGRDCGTVIMPQADFKFYLKTNARVRAIRRLSDQGENPSEENINFLTKEIEERDFRDENREVAPLVPASDAIILDNSDETLEETFNKMLDVINN